MLLRMAPLAPTCGEGGVEQSHSAGSESGIRQRISKCSGQWQRYLISSNGTEWPGSLECVVVQQSLAWRQSVIAAEFPRLMGQRWMWEALALRRSDGKRKQAVFVAGHRWREAASGNIICHSRHLACYWLTLFNWRNSALQPQSDNYFR
jgi:hypothetical protein